ncbi:MAG: hypothetical protein H8D67_30560 [Deltaproteobacteria bacterium]|nr:hypothetical protein [Deltaproteobacteria bacterium]
MLKQKFLCLVVIGVLLAFGQLANGGRLFKDDFEGDAVGKEPKNFEKIDNPTNFADFQMEVVKDPTGESGKVLHTLGYALHIPKAAGRDAWTDWIWEWDWMWSEAGFPGTAFRITGNDYYHISPRDNNTSVGFWYYNGGWNQIGGLAEYDFGLNTWNRFQVIAKGDSFTFKVKRRSDDTTFEEIEPLIEVKDSILKKGPPSACGTNIDAWVDNFIVGESAADMTFPVEPKSKLATTWGEIKNQH